MTPTPPNLRRTVARLALGLAIAAAWSPSPASADEPGATQQDEARARYARGVELYREGDFKLAVIEFERAYQIAPSFRMLYNVGEVHLQLGHYAKGLRALEAYLAQGGDRIPAQRRADVESDIASARVRTATLTVHTPVRGAAVEIDQEPLGVTPQDAVTVDAGEHRLRVTKPGYVAQEQVFVLAGGDVKRIDVTLAPERVAVARPAPAPAPARPEAWIAWGATGALAVATGVCGALAWKSANDLEGLRDTAGTSEADREHAADRARGFAIAADALGAGTVVAAVTAIYFSARRPSASSVRVGVGPGSMLVTGAF